MRETTRPRTELIYAADTVRKAPRRGFVASFVRKPLAVVAASYLVVLILATLLAPVIAPYGPDAQDLAASLQGPSAQHLLGTGTLGKDVLSRILYGGSVTLSGVVITLVVFTVIGVPAGMIAGYRGGWFDRFVLKSSELVFAIPGLIVLLVVLAVFPGNEAAAMTANGVLIAPQLARVVRSATLGVRQELFVRAAKASGLSDRTIITRHVFPRVAGVIVLQMSIYGGAAVLLETGLGFLGLGTSQASWGNLIGEASANIATNPWLLVPSGGIIITFIIALGLTGDGIRDALEERRQPPRMARKRQADEVRELPQKGVRAIDGQVTPLRAVDQRSREGLLLSVRGVSVDLAIDGFATQVIRDVSFDLKAGEALGIVGESGCGKSITAAALIGLLPRDGEVTTGSILFEGEELAGASPAVLQRVRGKKIGWISQDPIASLDPSYSAGAQIAEAVRLHTQCTRREAKARALELLALVRLPDPARVAKSYPHQLSGGMAQRVGIAAALAGNPSLIIADEPTTALDVTVQADILDVLRDLQSKGTAIILITHDWGVLSDLCERAVAMYAGEVIEEADIVEIVGRPRHPYTAALLKSDPHNAVRGTLLPALEGVVPAPTEWPVGCHFQTRCPLVTEACTKGPIPLVLTGGPTDQAHTSRCIRIDALVEKETA
jgi:peptide/nickel transport system permease protein